MAYRNRTNRLYRLMIADEVVLTLLGGWQDGNMLNLPLIECATDENGNRVDIPDDYQVEAVQYEYIYRSFDVLISHPTFPECNDGCLIPRLSIPYITIRHREINAGDMPHLIKAKGV